MMVIRIQSKLRKHIFFFTLSVVLEGRAVLLAAQAAFKMKCAQEMC